MAAGATVDVGILFTIKNAILGPFRQLNKDVEKVGRTSQKTANRLRAIQVVIAAIIAGKLKQFASQVLEVATAFESVQRQLTIFTGSSAKAAAELAELRKSFSNTAFSVLDISKALVRFKAAGVPDATFAVKALADAVAAFGGGKDEIDRASVAIQQIAGKGVVSMEELRQQLGEAIPFALKILAKSTNRNMGQLINDIQQAKISADEFNASFFKGLDEAFGGASEVPSLQNSIAKFKRVFQDGIVDAFKNTTIGEQLGLIVEGLGQKFKRLFESFDQGDANAIADIIRKWVVIFTNLAEAIGPAIKLLGQLFVVVTDLLVVLSDWANKYPYGLSGILFGGKGSFEETTANKITQFLKNLHQKLIDITDFLISNSTSGVFIKWLFGDEYEATKRQVEDMFGVIDEGFGKWSADKLTGFGPLGGIKQVAGWLTGPSAQGAVKTLSDMADAATDAADGLGDLVTNGMVGRQLARAGAEAIAGLEDDLAKISQQAISLNDKVIKLGKSIDSTFNSTEGFSFEGRITRLQNQIQEFKDLLSGMKDLDTDFAKIIADNIRQAEKALDDFKRAAVDAEFEKIQKRVVDLSLAMEKWVKPVTENEQLKQALREVDLEFQKFNLTINKQIADLERLSTIAPLSPEQQSQLEALYQMLIALEEKYQAVIKQTEEEYSKARSAAMEFAESIDAAVTDSLARSIEGLVNGTADLRDVLTSLYADITAAAAKYIVKLLIIKALNTFAPGTGSIAEGIMSFLPNANGNAFKGSIKPFADGGIVRGPTMFGLAGEAGTEAIMPLKRVNGKLGVAAEGGGGGGDTYNITVSAIDTQTGLQFLQKNMDHIVSGLNRKNNLNKGIGRTTPR